MINIPNSKEETLHSKDNTIISYRTIGTGPAVIVIPGALSLAKDFDKFAYELSHHFTVHTIDRRGRAESGPRGEDYSIIKECEDIEALREQTQAKYIFGHSFGGFIALEAARNNKYIQKVAVYEPGVSIDQSVNMNWASECETQLSQQKYLDAFISFAQGINPETTGKAPRWLLKIILPIAIKKTERQQKYDLLAGTILEHGEAARLDNTYENYREIEADVLLISGKDANVTGAGRSVSQLATVLPSAKMVLFPKLDHFGPGKKPKEVAKSVSSFFLGI